MIDDEAKLFSQLNDYKIKYAYMPQQMNPKTIKFGSIKYEFIMRCASIKNILWSREFTV